LEQADEDATFDRFSELPPEVREQIFEQYFDSLNNYLGGVSIPGGQPPIALASRQARLEALPLYYSRCLFRDCVSGNWPDGSFDRSVPAHHLPRLRLLELSDFDCDYKQAEYTVSISVNLNDEKCSTKVSKISSRKGGKNGARREQDKSTVDAGASRCHPPYRITPWMAETPKIRLTRAEVLAFKCGGASSQRDILSVRAVYLSCGVKNAQPMESIVLFGIYNRTVLGSSFLTTVVLGYHKGAFSQG
jgi:hypothetical protein